MESQHSLPQGPSRFLQIPGELRNQIYTYLFVSTPLTFGKESGSGIGRAPNPLAILRTCRQVNHESGPLWLGQVLFDFKKVEDMLDQLSVLPVATLSRIRHVRVGGDPLMLLPPGDDDEVYYRLVSALKLLPALRLDSLTVLGSAIGAVAYDTLEGLIKYGNGWRELHFITPNSKMLGFAKVDMFMAEPYWRSPQPRTWNDILFERDGVHSGASVTIYQSTQSDAPGSVTNSHTRRLFTQTSSPENPRDFGVAEDRELMPGPEKGKELLVVVKRGHHADIAEQDGPPYAPEDDIRHWSQGMAWPEIRRQCIDILQGHYHSHGLAF